MVRRPNAAACRVTQGLGHLDEVMHLVHGALLGFSPGVCLGRTVGRLRAALGPWQHHLGRRGVLLEDHLLQQCTMTESDLWCGRELHWDGSGDGGGESERGAQDGLSGLHHVRRHESRFVPLLMTVPLAAQQRYPV